MKSERTYFVYILTNSGNSALYVGVTNDLLRRMYEHRHKILDGYTARYNVTKLVYFEVVNDVGIAIAREKQIKGLLRYRKEALINKENHHWKDLSENFLPSD